MTKQANNHNYCQKEMMPYPIFVSMMQNIKERDLLKVIWTIALFIGILTNGFSQLMLPQRTELYRDDVIARIDIEIEPSSLDYILAPENANSNELFEATFIFSNGTVQDTLDRVGFRLRGNTSRNAKKKSFKIDINEFVPGRKYFGVTKINLNGQHNDPTSARAKICADLADQMGIPSMRSNHVELYINNEYKGLYTNVEHIDQNYVKKRFNNKNGNLYKCLYPADLNFKGEDPNAYKEVIYGRRNYALKNNLPADDYTDFAEFVTVLNQTSNEDFVCEIEKVFNVDTYLKCIIFDILTGNWDGPIYNKNNFYLYHNEATDLFEYIPYDVDNTLGIDWLNKDWGNRDIYNWSHDDEYRPLYSRIMAIEEYRNRFSFYMQDILLTVFNEAQLYPYLDTLKTLLKPSIENDTYYTLDYGFDVGHFEDGFDLNTPFYQTAYGLKSYIQTRLISAFTQLEVNDIAPIITEHFNTHPNTNEAINILAKVEDNSGLSTVEVCYSVNGGAQNCISMNDDGNHNDGDAQDGKYGVYIPAINTTAQIQYYIRAIDDSNKESVSPSCGERSFFIEEEDLKLAINEFMASNNVTIADEEGEYDDWIELYNFGNTPIYLGDKYLSDNPENRDKWAMPNHTLEAGEYLLIWADDDRNQGTFHTNFKLSKGGEYIGIFDDDDNENALIDEIQYEAQPSDFSFGRLPNGTGDFATLIPTPGTPNLLTNVEEETFDSYQFIIAPNPTTNSIKIESDAMILDVRIFNSMGEVVECKLLGTNEWLLPKTVGLYYIHITSESKTTHVQKVIKL